MYCFFSWFFLLFNLAHSHLNLMGENTLNKCVDVSKTTQQKLIPWAGWPEVWDRGWPHHLAGPAFSSPQG